MDEQKLKSPKAALIWSLVGFLILGGFAVLILINGKSPQQSFGTPIQSAEFENGDVFQLYQAEAVRELRLEYPTPRFSFSGNGSSGSSNGYLSYRLERSGERLSAAKIEGRRMAGKNLTNLIVVGRMETPTAMPIIPKIISIPSHDSRKPEKLMEMKWDGYGDFDDLKDTPKTNRDGHWIEVEDGRGGWLPMIGSIVFQKNDGRSLSLRQSFPRIQKELKLRILTDTGEEKVITMPNPGYFAPGSSTWTADPKPWKKSFSEFELELTGFEEPQTDTSGRVLVPRPKLVVIPHDRSLPANSFRPQSPEISDETGNSGQIHRFPGVKFVRFQGIVTRNRDQFPWKIADVTPILEYRVNDMGETEFTLLPKMNDYHVIAVEQNGDEISLKGKGPAGYDFPDTYGLVDFKKGTAQSKQVMRFSGGSSSGSTSSTEFEVDFSGTLPAGSEGVLAVPNLPFAFPYEFTLPMDEIPGQ